MSLLPTGEAMGDVVERAISVDAEISSLVGKYLTFALGEGRYGVHISKIREIVKMMPVTAVPGTCSYVQGVINLRGKILPIVDLRAKFGLPLVKVNERSCIIVVEAHVLGKANLIGTIVDCVQEVSNFQAKQLAPAPQYGLGRDNDFILGMARGQDERVIVLLNIEKALADPRITSIVPASLGTMFS